MEHRSFAQAILESRAVLLEKTGRRRQLPPRNPEAEEGGCGVTGFACNIPVSGRHIFEPSVQMHNRGNGKGGGIAAVGLEANKLGVDQETLDKDFLLQVALLDPAVQAGPGRAFHPAFLPGGSRDPGAHRRRLP